MNYYEEIREQLVNNEINKKVKDYTKNKTELQTYYNVGKLLIEAQGGKEKSKYGNQLIKQYSYRLTKELGKGYGWRNLYNMRSFYLIEENFKILQALPAIFTWSHIIELLSINDINKINYYIIQVYKYNLSYRELHDRIKSNEYERLPDKTIGIIIVKKDNKYILEYSSDKRIYSTSFILV